MHIAAMMNDSFDALAEVYQCSDECDYSSTAIPFPDLHRCSQLLDYLIRNLGDAAEDDFWPRIIRTLRRLWFDMAVAPLTSDDLKQRVNAVVRLVQPVAPRVPESYPNVGSCFSALVDQITSLSVGKLDHLLDEAARIVHTYPAGTTTALLVKAGRLLPATVDATQSVAVLRHCRVVSPAALRDDRCFDRMLVFGLPRWYPDFVFSAPRAKQIHVVKYVWMHGVWRNRQYLAAIVKPATPSRQRTEMPETAKTDAGFDVDSLLPQPNWSGLASRIQKEVDEAATGDTVPARAYMLEDDWVVFLEADQSASALIIDIREDANNHVRRVELSELERDMFLLLRSEGGGDYIIPIADEIMGDFARMARERQKRWKSMLRAGVEARGRRAIIADLIGAGSQVANQLNLSNWMWPRSIRTRDEQDFLAIMRVIGLEAEAAEYWRTMQRISEAHAAAGHKIREMLLAQVKSKDLSELQRRGLMTFELQGQDAGSMTAFRIRHIADKTTPVTIWRLGEPIEPEQ
jgi:hypothetical protein